jgi:predicted FMN-binding regulatory protein PaiB
MAPAWPMRRCPPAHAGTLRFHLAPGTHLTRHLDGARALAVVVGGPDGYVSGTLVDRPRSGSDMERRRRSKR